MDETIETGVQTVIHVNRYTRRRHGRASHGGPVNSYTKNEKASADLTHLIALNTVKLVPSEATNEEKIAQHKEEYGDDFGEPTIVKMTPAQYLNYAPPMDDDDYDEARLNQLKSSYLKIGFVNKEQLLDMPWLTFKAGKPHTHWGRHDGRHRMEALRQLGVKEVDVVIFDE